jgi:hypothetical protein
MTSNTAPPPRVIDSRQGVYLGGQTLINIHSSKLCGHRLWIANSDRVPRPRMRMGSQP